MITFLICSGKLAFIAQKKLILEEILGCMEAKKTLFVEKKQNSQKNLILKELYENKSLSGSEISKKIKVSFPTVTRFLNELITSGLVVEKGTGESIGGRRPGMYGINPESGYILSMDIRRDCIQIGLFDLTNSQQGEIMRCSIANKTNNDIIDSIFENSEGLMSSLKIKREAITAIGVSLTGLIDLETGENLSFLKLGNKGLKEILESHFKKPVYIDNDACAMAMAELSFGLAKNRKNVLVINIGWAIGMGMIFEKSLYVGNSGFAGEFGHIPVVECGELCYCGKKGCLETLASGKAIVEKAIFRLSKGETSRLIDTVSGDLEKIDMALIVKAAVNGDQFSIELIQEVGRVIGKALVTVLHLLNPEMVVFGGIIAEAGDLLMDTIQQSLRKGAIWEIADDTELKISELGEQSSLKGAYALVMERLFDESEQKIALL